MKVDYGTRRSGRTTRMILATLAKCGEAPRIVVAMANPRMVEYARHKFITGAQHFGIPWEARTPRILTIAGTEVILKTHAEVVAQHLEKGSHLLMEDHA